MYTTVGSALNQNLNEMHTYPPKFTPFLFYTLFLV